MLLRLINHTHAAFKNLVYDFIADRTLDAEETKHGETTLKFRLSVKLRPARKAISLLRKILSANFQPVAAQSNETLLPSLSNSMPMRSTSNLPAIASP